MFDDYTEPLANLSQEAFGEFYQLPDRPEDGVPYKIPALVYRAQYLNPSSFDDLDLRLQVLPNLLPSKFFGTMLDDVVNCAVCSIGKFRAEVVQPRGRMVKIKGVGGSIEIRQLIPTWHRLAVVRAVQLLFDRHFVVSAQLIVHGSVADLVAQPAIRLYRIPFLRRLDGRLSRLTSGWVDWG